MLGDSFGRLRKSPYYGHATRGLLVLAVPALALLFAHFGRGLAFGSPGAKDFVEYWSAGQLMRAGENPYDIDKLRDLQSRVGSPHQLPIIMWNPPWLLVWVYPLLLLPFTAAALAWLILGLALVILGATFVWSTFADPSEGRPVGIAWFASILFVPTLFNLGLGQISSLLFLGVAGFLYFAARRRDFPAGMFLALTTIKPHVVYLLWIAAIWWALKEGRWKVLAGVATPLVPALGLLAILWPRSLAGYRAAMAHPPLYWRTPTLGGILRTYLFEGSPRVQFLPPLLVGLAFLGYLVVRRPAMEWKSMMAPLLLVSLPTAAYGWSFDQVVLLVPCLWIIVLLAEGRDLKTGAWGMLLAGLVLVDAAMAIEGMAEMDELTAIWVPCALGALFLLARISQRAAGMDTAEIAGQNI